MNLEGIYKLNSNVPIFADWYTGVLRIPKGGILNYIHAGFDSVYEQELYIIIENGIVIRSKTIDNRNRVFESDDISQSQSLRTVQNRKRSFFSKCIKAIKKLT